MTLETFAQKIRTFQESRLLLTALELDLFTAVGSGAGAEDIAEKLGTHPRATRMLLNALVAAGALEKSEEVFRNTEELAPYLVAGSKEYARPGMLHIANLWHTWSTLTEAVRAGTAVSRPGVEAHDPEWTRAFIDAMHQIASRQAPAVVAAAGPEPVLRMLDVGGGSGAYSIAFAQAHPDLHGVVFDIAEVTPVAARHIAEAGLSERIGTRNGDLTTDDLGEGFDLVLLSAICHMLDEDGNRGLLRRCFAATAPGGRLVIRDFILNEDRTSPKEAAMFALNMLVGTLAGSTYSDREYLQWLKEAGYKRIERPEGAGDLIVAWRAR